MDSKQLKRVLAGMSIVALLAGAGLSATACKKSGESSCSGQKTGAGGAGSCSGQKTGAGGSS